MSKFFRKFVFCGCSRSHSDNRSNIANDSTLDDVSKLVPSSSSDNCAEESNDLARYFDLSSIKFIDDEDADDESFFMKNEELDGPNAVRIRDGWVIAVERGVRERLKELAALRSIQLRDIEAILDHQINETGASTSEESTRKDVTSNQVTVTLADEDVRNTNAFFTKLSNGTIPKGLTKDGQDTREGKTLQERKDVLEKQQTSSDETNLLQPVQTSNKVGERRASSPFQNGRTEVLIGEPEGGPRSPRGSTSSAVNDGNFLNPPDEREAIYRKQIEVMLIELLAFVKSIILSKIFAMNLQQYGQVK
ncbi:protein PALS1 isoform X1 [Vespula maculifrons]|uniref:Protein PALS1 isoform X1 n=1 Tax=Vespula maculifrons TaxID=7453 RepID=A0ABD2CVE9_VESMC